MRFTKYEDKGGYHIRDYIWGRKYRKHVDFIKKWVTEDKTLDIGAGDGVITYLTKSQGIDNEAEAIHIAQTVGFNVHYGDAYNLQFADNSFDACLMIDVIEHFDEPEKALAEARRVAPVLYIATPERKEGRRVRDKFHVQEWTRDEFTEFMKQNGYELTGDYHFAEKGDTMYARFERNPSYTQ